VHGERNGVAAAFAAAATVLKLFFAVDAEAIRAAADWTGPGVFAGANAPERAEALSDRENVGLSRAFDQAEPLHGPRVK
jgi:hypothetical protein